MANQDRSHIDVFMHSIFKNRLYPEYHKSAMFGHYTDEMYSTADSSSNRVILTNGLNAEFLKRYPDSEIFRTVVDERGHSFADIVPEDKERFKRFILGTTNSLLRYHGAYAGVCVAGSILDVLMIQHAQDKIVDAHPEMRGFIEKQAQIYHESRGNYMKSNIRLGVVLSHPKVGTYIAYPHAENLELRHGNNIFQLMDDNTSLHGKTLIMEPESHHYHEFTWRGSTANETNPPVLQEVPVNFIYQLPLFLNMKQKKGTFNRYLLKRDH